MVIESAPEKAELKIDLLGKLDEWCEPSTIIATNSSSYKSSELVGKVSEEGRRRVLNTHYYQPPELDAVELMSCGATDPAIFPFLSERIQEVGLYPIDVLKQSTGFIFNRIWAAIKRETMAVIADEVGKPEDIDRLFRSWFQSKGAPCDLMDRVGLETVCNIEDHYIKERDNIDRRPVDYIRREFVDKGILGVKTGKGLLNYDTANGQVNGASKKPSLREQLVGAWELKEYSAFPVEKPSEKTYPMGKEAQGIILYTSNGYMSAQLQVPGQPPFQSKDMAGGSQEELAEVGKNYFAYTGHFYLDEHCDEPLLMHEMRNCSFPNWLGDIQRRTVKIEEEEHGEKVLVLGPEAPVLVDGEKRMTRLAWRRLPDNHAERPS